MTFLGKSISMWLINLNSDNLATSLFLFIYLFF